MEFLDLIETIRAEDASVQKLFGGEGESTRKAQQMAHYTRRLAETAQFVGEIMQGRRPAYQLREAMSTSDFPYLFGDILDRQLLANYREWPQVWNAYARRGTTSDFRTVKRFTVSGGEAVLDAVPEGNEYPAAALTDAVYSYAVKKYGRRMPFNWETMINDDLDALKDIPARLGKAARRSEEKFATQLHVDASGPHASVYTSGNGNIATANPLLGITGLQTAMIKLAAQTDGDSEPVYIEMVTLEVPPALEITARNILNATELEIDPNASAGTEIQRLRVNNWMRNRVNLVVNPYIPIVASSANGNTSWFLHADPQGDRPAFEMGFLRGHTEPEIFIKAPNAQRVGGGVNPMDGDFDTDSIQYKVRHVFGGVALDPKMTVGSNGTGSA